MTTVATRRIAYMPLDELQPAARNPKRHDEAAIGASIDRFGYVEPMVLDERTGRLVAGHGRLDTLLAAQQRGGGATRRGESRPWWPLVRPGAPRVVLSG